MYYLNLNTILNQSAGGAPTFAPEADFIGSPLSLNQNNTVNFTDQSTVDPLGPAITGWSWVFEGGTPATSTLQNPTGILYPTDGTYDVTLTATNADGSGSKTKQDYITVLAYVPPVAIDEFRSGNYGTVYTQADVSNEIVGNYSTIYYS